MRFKIGHNCVTIITALSHNCIQNVQKSLSFKPHRRMEHYSKGKGKGKANVRPWNQEVTNKNPQYYRREMSIALIYFFILFSPRGKRNT